MPYATQQDLIDKYGETEILQLSDRDQNGAIDSAVVERALADADALVDSYVGKRHKLPLTEAPPRLTAIAAAVAYFNLFHNNPPEYARTAYEDALRFLRDIAAGTAVLELGAGGTEPERDGPVVLNSGPDRVYSRDTLKGY